LVVVVGLGRIVWGAPPSDEPPPAEPASETTAAPTTPDTLDPTLDPIANASNEAAPEPAPEDVPQLDEDAASVPGASSLRAKMEASMGEIGELAVEARSDEDLVRATCVLDKQERANDVMDLGTSQLLIIRDGAASEQARSFALEKLDAASARLDKLVEEAKGCGGQLGPEDTVNITRRESDEPNTIPVLNPTAGLGPSPVPPPMDGGWPPAASPVE
jgi:hypothetical protein